MKFKPCQALISTALSMVAIAGYSTPPYSGTIFISSSIVTSNDPTVLTNAVSAGQGYRTMFDRRINGWTNVNAFLIDAFFDDGLKVEAQVNPEFGTAAAAFSAAQRYATVLGRLPTCVRMGVKTMWIHMGMQPFGGGNNNVLIHTGQADQYEASGILEEAMLHESCHSSLDSPHGAAAGWLAAQSADPDFISAYARDNPTREDVAESFVPYFAIRCRPERLALSMVNTICRTIPNRIAYFDRQDLPMHPASMPGPLSIKSIRRLQTPQAVKLVWASWAGKNYAVYASTNCANWSALSGTVASEGNETTFTNATSFSVQPSRFYRVAESP